MKKSFVFLGSVLALLVSVPMMASDGGGSSGGGDSSRPEQNSAWFLGDGQVIKACYRRADDFGATDEEIQKIILEGFTTWKSYSRRLGWQMSGWQINSDAQLSANCNGSEDLVFHLGTSNEEVARARQNFNDPVGFAFRTSYDVKRGWGRGFVWIKKRGTYQDTSLHWTELRELSNLVVHELGHVMGNEHIMGTVMDEEMSRVLYASHFGIDHERELVQCLDCSYAYEGRLGRRWWQDPLSQTQEAFTVLTGESGGVPSIYADNARLESGPWMTNVKLIISGTRYEFPIEMMSQENSKNFEKTWIEDGRMVFKAVKNLNGSGPVATQREPFRGYIAYAKLKTVSGRELTLVIEKNLAKDNLFWYGPAVHIRYFDNGKLKTLFQATELKASAPLL